MTAVPEALQADTPEARVLRQKIWRQCNEENQHFIGVVVGPEGSGKSHTALKIGEVCDPSFSAERVMFDPATFLSKLQEWKEEGKTQGRVVVSDEAGVGIGVRTWYDEDQIKFNQVLQVIRDENMAIIFTLPRLNELDSQTRGRIRGYMEMTDLEEGDYAKFKYLNWDPTRDERDKIYRQYPTLKVNGYPQKIRRLCVSPPSDELVRNYQRRKAEFQKQLYQETYDTMTEDPTEDFSPSEVAEEVKEDGVENFLSWHGAHKRWYLDKDLIRAEYGLSHSTAQTAKKLVVSDSDVDVEAAAEKKEAPDL